MPWIGAGEFRANHAVTIADVAPIDVQARRYLLEPGDAAWNEVVRALDGALRETEADDL